MRYWIFFLCLGLTHCALLTGPVAVPQKFVLAVNIPTVAAVPTAQALLVAKPTVAPALASTKMAYRKGLALDYYTKNEWASSPDDLLLPLMVRTLQNTGHYPAVVPEPFMGITQLRLDTQLLQFTRVFNGANSVFNVVLQAELTDKTSGKIIRTQRFDITEPVGNITPAAGVVAANNAVAQLLQQLAYFCLSARVNP